MNHVWLSLNIVCDIGLEAYMRFVEEEVLEDPESRRVKVGGDVLDQFLKKILKSGVDDGLRTHNGLEDDNPHAESVLHLQSS
jgi:hypothetical protein